MFVQVTCHTINWVTSFIDENGDVRWRWISQSKKDADLDTCSLLYFRTAEDALENFRVTKGGDWLLRDPARYEDALEKERKRKGEKRAEESGREYKAYGARSENPFGPIFSTGEQPAGGGVTPRMWDVFFPGDGYRRPLTTIRIIFHSPPHPADVYRALEADGQITDRSGMDVDFSDLDDEDDPQILVDFSPTKHHQPPVNRFLLLPSGTLKHRKPNPLGPIFAEGFSRPEEELFRWNVLQPDGSYIHVFLPKYPSIPEIAHSLGRDARSVISFKKYNSGDQRGIEFDDFSFYKLNRVW
jgi:hypothetical protein